MIPTGVVGKRKFRAYMAFTLLMINVVVFIGELILMAMGQDTFNNAIIKYAMNVCAIGVDPLPVVARNSIFSMFLHGSFIHLFSNMMFLWIFAPRVEEYLGHRRFLLFYLLAGFGAAAAHALLGGIVCSTETPYAGYAIGASGAIAGVMGAFLFLHPGARIETVFFWVARLRIPAFFFLVFYFLMDLVNAVDASNATNVAHWAHIGGFVTGFVIVFIGAMFKPVPKVDPFEHLDD